MRDTPYISMNGQELMAKSDNKTTLFGHLRDCAIMASAVVERSPFSKNYREQLKKDLFFCAMVHDVGKSASGFQYVMYGRAKDWGGKRHEILSTSFAATFPDIKEEQLFAILTHHRSIFSDMVTSNEKTLPQHQIPFKEDIDNLSPVCSKMQQEWYERSNDFLQVWNQLCKELQKQEWELKEIPHLKDIGLSYEWLDRSKRYGQLGNIPEDKRRYASVLRGALISSDHLSSAEIVNLPSPLLLNNHPFFGEDETPRPFQVVSGNVSNDAILRAPTGSGKTNAALLWAAHNQIENGRLFYVLPYTASINAMFDTLQSIFGKESVGLLHHKNVSHLYKVQEDATHDVNQAKHLADLARELYYPVKVCTPHQILRSALRGRGWEQALIEFPGACFVFDEIHAYEPRIVGLIFAMIPWLKSLGAKVLFASATMPRFLQQLITEHLNEKLTIIEPDPSTPLDSEIITKKRHTLEIISCNVLEYMDEFIESFPDKKLLIICNHVPTAQSVYKLILEGIEEGKYDIDLPVLLHSRFSQQDRSDLEKTIITEQPKILIATQVIEVSLNLDYNVCITEPAPIDALIQRFGRVNRYGYRNPETVIVCRKQVNNYPIYAESIVQKTLQSLEPLQNAVLTERSLIETADLVYADGFDETQREEFERALNYPDLKDFDGNTVAGVYRNWVEDVIEGTDQSIEVLPKTYREKYLDLRKNKQWVEANMLLVPLRIKQFSMLISKRYIERISEDEGVYVITAPYDSQIGLQISNLPEKTNETAVFI